MANTRETMGEQACLDALVADTLDIFEDDSITKVGAYRLRDRTSLTKLILPRCTSLGSYSLAGCKNLESIDILGTGSIGNYSLPSTKLHHIVLRGSTLTTLSGTSVIKNTPIAYGDGAIYVPLDLVTEYKANNQWDMCTILPISEYPKSGLPETVSDSWSDIIAASANGTYDSKYSIGDVKSMDIDGTTYYFQLVAKNADVLASDGITTVPMSWFMFKKLYKTDVRMNSSHTTDGGWEASGARSLLSSSILPLMPSEVQAAIKEVRKYSDTYESAIVHDQITADKLWIPSGREVFGNTYYEQTGAIYSEALYSEGTRTRFNQYGTIVSWWLRSARNATKFAMVTNVGAGNSDSAAKSTGLAFGFCI